MAKMGELKIEVEKFLKDTRIIFCFSSTCKFLNRNTGCKFKTVEIGEHGLCKNFEVREKE